MWTTTIIRVLMRFCNFRKVLCRIVAFIAVYNFSLRVLPTGLSGLRIARTNENEALRNGGFFRLFSWNSDYQKCMKGGKSSHRSSFFLEGLGIIVCRPERKATLRYCILFDGSMRNASRLYWAIYFAIGLHLWDVLFKGNKDTLFRWWEPRFERAETS